MRNLLRAAIVLASLQLPAFADTAAAPKPGTVAKAKTTKTTKTTKKTVKAVKKTDKPATKATGDAKQAPKTETKTETKPATK